MHIISSAGGCQDSGSVIALSPPSLARSLPPPVLVVYLVVVPCFCPIIESICLLPPPTTRVVFIIWTFYKLSSAHKSVLVKHLKSVLDLQFHGKRRQQILMLRRGSGAVLKNSFSDGKSLE